MNYSLPRSEILRNKNEIASLFKNGQWIRGRYFHLVFQKHVEQKVLFGTAKRIRPAVRRIRFKRYARETYRLHKEIIPLCHIGLIVHSLPKEHLLDNLYGDFSLLIETLKTKIS